MRRFVLSGYCLLIGCSFDQSGAAQPGAPVAPDSGPEDVVDGGPVEPDAGLPIEEDAAPPPDLLFADGFEQGLGPPWSGSVIEAGDTVSRTTDRARSGAYSAICQTGQPGDGQASMFVDLKDRRNLYIRAYFSLNASLTTSSFVTLLSTVNTDSGWTNLWSVGVDRNGTLFAWNDRARLSFGSGAALTPNTWHRLDMRAKTGGNGRVTVALDGAEIIDATTDELLPITRVLVGVAWQGTPTEAHTIYIDDVAIDDEPIE